MSKIPASGVIKFSDLSNVAKFVTPNNKFGDFRTFDRNGIPSTGVVNMGMFRNQCAVGLYSSAPGTSASNILAIHGTLANGTYYINCSGTAKATYCLMGSAYDGGGWMLLMKMNNGNTFGFNASYWTSSNVLNETDMTRNAGDSKYDVFNHIPIKDVMAIWPARDVGSNTGGSFTVADGWVWNMPNWYNNGSNITALGGFQISRDGNPLNIGTYSGFSTTAPMWTYQTGTQWQGFVGSHFTGIPANHGARWGWFWNNEVNTLYTTDAIAGIGVINIGTQYSAGDFYNWTGVNKYGYNRSIQCELYGR